jgi:integrase
MDLTRKRNQERLGVRREPYWQRLARGAYLGFRRGPDTWIARYRDRSGRQHYKALEGAREFDEARTAAELWLEQIGGAGVRSAKRGTVKAALEAYLGWLGDQGRSATATETEGRFKLCVYDDPVGAIRLEDATREDFREWRQRLRKGRQARSVNRQVRAVVAGLNRALDLGFTGNPRSWSLEPLSDDAEESGETTVFLTKEQREAVMQKASPALSLFLRALEYTGARPGEIARATVANLDVKGRSLTLFHRKGRPVRLRPRTVALDSNSAEFFGTQARRKLPAAFLFTDSDGREWRRHVWAQDLRTAIRGVNGKARGKTRIPAGASAYTFRHARISELLQVHGVDPLTVGQQTGTSIAMIEKAYFKFIPSAMREKLEQAQSTDRSGG